jgi:hypothetical protein
MVAVGNTAIDAREAATPVGIGNEGGKERVAEASTAEYSTATALRLDIKEMLNIVAAARGELEE